MTTDTRKEFEWYSEQIERERKDHNRLWNDYTASRYRLERLERDRSTVYLKIIQDADSRLKRSGNGRA